MSTLERFWRDTLITPGCWLWTGCKGANGYGVIYISERKKQTGAHRYSYERFNGPLHPGYCACHTCDTPGCVNPGHLFAGTVQDNARDMAQKGRARGQQLTHCLRGHAFTSENTRRRGDTGLLRVCRACDKIYSQAKHERRKLKKAAL